MNRTIYRAGFTLVELIVVMGIVAGMLVFSFPVFRSFTHDAQNKLHDLASLTEELASRAVEEHKDYTLHLDAVEGRIFFTHESMDKKTLETARQDALVLPENLRIVDVEFPGLDRRDLPLYRIRFRRQGYSDFALIHLEKEGRKCTLKIEPFLPRGILIESWLSLEDCI